MDKRYTDFTAFNLAVNCNRCSREMRFFWEWKPGTVSERKSGSWGVCHRCAAHRWNIKNGLYPYAR